jgi:predicted nucleotidyltransferase
MSAIARWAEQNPWIFEIRLFGSRAKGTARADSDIDLAVTVTSNERGNTTFGSSVRLQTNVALPLTDAERLPQRRADHSVLGRVLRQTKEGEHFVIVPAGAMGVALQ